MMVAKLARKSKTPIIVAGDFNNVAWSRTSKLFSKIAKLKDARINNGIYSTFPAHLPLLGFPIDLLFHSGTITVHKIEVMSSIGSDHLPLQFRFSVNGSRDSTEKLNAELKNLADQKIEEGKEAAKSEN